MTNNTTTIDNTFVAAGKRTVALETAAVQALETRIGDAFVRACHQIHQCPGRTVVMGMGKSGHIGKKVAATLASTGTPAFFVHPGEASHGDLGMITPQDVVIAISYSGHASEILTLIPRLKRLGTPIISMTGNATSPLAQQALIHLDIQVESEACPLDLAPTASTTATLVMGDALAVALLEARGFTADDFAFTHPGGTLGQRLLTKVSDIMHTGDELPRVQTQTPLAEALLEISQKGFGITTVVNEDGVLCGVFTDGDLRRSIDQAIDLNDTPINQVMSTQPSAIQAHRLAVDALNTMETNAITAVIVADEAQRPIGIIHMHDLLKAGIV